MAPIDPEARRAEHVRPVTEAEMAGSRGADGRGVDLPKATYNNPGPTANLRGIEPNTDREAASNYGEPMIQTVTAGEAPPRGPAFDAPDDVAGDVEGPESDDGWTTHDSASNNSVKPDWPQHGSFTSFGEDKPGWKFWVWRGPGPDG